MGTDDKPGTDTSIANVKGLPFSVGRTRYVGSLVVTDKFANAHKSFAKLKEKKARKLRFGMDKWTQRIPAPELHHGWDSKQHGGEYTHCYVFKHVHEGIRIYGFVMHPKSDQRSEVCCLVHMTTKREDETNLTILKTIEEIFSRPDVVNALEKFWAERLNPVKTEEAKDEQSEIKKTD